MCGMSEEIENKDVDQVDSVSFPEFIFLNTKDSFLAKIKDEIVLNSEKDGNTFKIPIHLLKEIQVKSNIIKGDCADRNEIIINFIGAFRDNLKTGFKTIENEEKNNRQSICERCKFWEKKAYMNLGKCKKCGCSGIKLWMASSKCPLGKW